MRNLTIARAKSFVACLAKIKIYIEDPTSNETTINNIPCRKIGELKNGEEKTFQIENQAAKVFVIADKLSKNYCNEYYQLPEGQDDVYLSGKNKFNPAAGNAFRFDHNENDEIIANRKHGTRKGLIVLVIAVVIGAVIGYLVASGLFSRNTPKAKTFSSDGMSITLTEEFRKTNINYFTAAYESNDVAVFILREAFTLFDGLGDYTLDQYADLMILSNGLSAAKRKTGEGLTYFTYTFTNPETKITYQYFSYVYKSNDAFWLVQFATPDQNAQEYAKQITKWAKSVGFSD